MHLTGPVECPEQPFDATADGHQCHENEPEPNEDENLLVEEVDGKNALHDVTVDTGLVTYLEVAECDPWEPLGRRPVQPPHQLVDHVDAIQVEIIPQEHIEHEELPDGVGDVDQFDEDVGCGEVVAV